MRGLGLERRAALAGVAFVLLYVIGLSLGVEAGTTDAEILEHYADDGARTRELVAFVLIAVAALAFVVFAASLRELLRRDAPGTELLVSVGWAGGIIAAALLLAGNALSRGVAFVSSSDEFTLDPDLYRLVDDTGFLLLVSGIYAATLVVVAVSIAALRGHVLPGWLGWAGLVAAVLLAVVLLTLVLALVGFLVLFVWVLVVGGTLLARRPGPA